MAAFAIGVATGVIRIADTAGLAAGQTWQLAIRATDAAADTADATVTVALVRGLGPVYPGLAGVAGVGVGDSLWAAAGVGDAVPVRPSGPGAVRNRRVVGTATP